VTALGSPARHLGTVGSTMDEAARWASEGAPHGALVVAEAQAAGRGRHGRTWAGAPGQSLLFTLVLHPTLPPDRAGLVPLAAGVAVAEAVAGLGVEATLKWPNDVRVGGRKLAGVLVEARARRVLVGVGMNVGQAGFPPEIAEAATSLRLETGQPVDRLAPLSPILERLAERLAEAETQPAALIAAVAARMEGLGSTVDVRDPATGQPLHRGIVLGLAPDGALRLAAEAGEVAVYAGEVTLAPP